MRSADCWGRHSLDTVPAKPSSLVLITGGAGFIGANLAAALVARGLRVTVLDDLSAGEKANLDGVDAPLVTGSVLDASLVDRLVATHDAVVHLAGVAGVPRSLADPVGTYQVNATGTVCVLER